MVLSHFMYEQKDWIPTLLGVIKLTINLTSLGDCTQTVKYRPTLNLKYSTKSLSKQDDKIVYDYQLVLYAYILCVHEIIDY